MMEKLKNVLLAEALERSEIPDKYGCWRPRSTKRYIMTGDRPRGCFFKKAEFNAVFRKEVFDEPMI